MKPILFTTFALVAFAFNSILCRLALGADVIDANSFTAIRLVSGTITLALVLAVSGQTKHEEMSRGNWLSAFFLFAYAICFSFAYVGLTTATGALILFGVVQATMILSALVSGERPGGFEWLGLLLALAGLVYLVFPGLESPPLANTLLMVVAGISWGFYTLRGRSSKEPLADTTGNFFRTIPFVVLVTIPFFSGTKLSVSGALFAVLSGSIASGIGYSVWYAALRFHTATRAAILQLAVPVIAAVGGLVFMAEPISLRLVLASCLILGGIALVVSSKSK